MLHLLLLSVTSNALATTPDAEGSLLNPPGRSIQLRFDAEVGVLAPLAHTIQFGKEGTEFDYVDDGGQDVLFAYTRFQAGIDLGRRHSVVLLYQPLDLSTSVVLDAPLTVDTVTFAEGTPLDLRYGFSFWRASWLYDLAPATERELGLGLGLQLRNADISFTSADGAQRFAERDVGPVPLLAFRGRGSLSSSVWMGGEISGMYAPVKYLNGADVDVVGAIADGSLRVGMDMGRGADLFLNLRYIGGGASGTSKNSEALGDGYTANWVHFGALSIGAGAR